MIVDKNFMEFIRKLNFKYDPINYLNIGNTLFLTGVFFLPSALPVGSLFLLASIIISFCISNKNFLENKWNHAFFLCIVSILVSTFYSCILNPSESLLDFEKSKIWLNLFNWVPIYFAFIGFQIYLKSEKQRLKFQKVLVAGTVPVIISCIMQKFFNLYGPFETLFGTVVWFNYKHSAEQVSGLFNNPNYLGMWLTLCLPFALSALKLEKNNYLNSVIMYLINILIIYFAFATYSRNALLGVFLSFFILIERKKLFFFSIFFLISLLFYNYVLSNFINIYQVNFSDLSQANIFQKLSSLQSYNPRISIWSNALNFISMRPFLGWGAGSFPYVFFENSPLKVPFSPESLTQYQHTHNLIIELAYNFGIPIALLIVSTIFSLFIKVLKKIKSLNKSLSSYLLYKSLLASFFIFLIAHLSDITYYDGKISILFALLLAGVTNIANENIELSINCNQSEIKSK